MATIIKTLLLLLFAMQQNVYASVEKYALESFETNQLQVKNVVIHEKCQLAYIKGPDDAMYIATIGSYVGKNHGMVVKIGSKFVIVRELVRAENGVDWIDREVRLQVK